MNYKHIIIFAFITAILTSCTLRNEISFSGQTMGTSWHIKVVVPFYKDVKGLKEKIDRRLVEINKSMSTYIKESEISRFNALKKAGAPFEVSEDFYQVLKTAESIYSITNGAWDGTVSPLVDLWGFGSGEHPNRIPKKSEIKAALELVGFDQIEIRDDRHIVKKKPDITLDLASIAKGYGVDQIAGLISREGYRNFLVEIGGEVFAAGLKKNWKKWRVGINTPRKDSAYDAVYKVVTVRDKGFATSGDYRIFFEIGKRRFSHIIHPLTGMPVSNGVISVSVLTEKCITADGLATAIMVMGADSGISMVNKMANTECLVITVDKYGRMTNHYSAGFITE